MTIRVILIPGKIIEGVTATRYLSPLFGKIELASFYL